MNRFTSFATIKEEHLLTEALNNPVEYYMTDDTKMPESIFAAFDIDGKHYIMSLVQSDDKGVYMFEVGKTSDSGGKTLWWRFHDKSHMLPVMATAMNFLQASTAWMQGKVKGIAIHFKMGAAANAQRAQRIAERIIKRAYVKSFNVIPVSQPPLTDKDKYYYQKMRYVFIAKKGVSPSTLFGGKTFKKYDIEGGEAPIEAVSQLEPKKKKKATNTLKPSKKYSFGQYDVDTPVDDDLLDKVSNIKKVEASTPSSQAPTAEDPYYEMLMDASGGGTLRKAGMVTALPSLQSMIQNLQSKGFDQSKINWNDLGFVIQSKASAAEKTLLQNANLLPPASNKDVWIKIMKKVADISDNPSVSSFIKKIASSGKDNTNKFLAKYPNGGSQMSPPQNATPQDNIVIQSSIKPEDLQGTLPGSGTKVSVDKNRFVIEGEDPIAKENHLFTNLDYGTKLKSMSGYNNLRSYTGNAYDSYNSTMRQVVGQLLEQQNPNKYTIEQVTKSTSKFAKLSKMFEKVDPLPESLWVYRGTTIPNVLKKDIEPGYQYVDPAFLSTSVSPTIGMGLDKLRIFLPKGSRVLPVLKNSKHSNEKEVLLPPASVIKIIEVQKVPNGGKVFLQGVFMGSSWKSISEALKKQLTEAINYGNIKTIMETIRLMEQLDNQKYDPEEKFGGEYNSELAEMIQQEIDKGNFKIDGPEQSDDD